MKKIAIIAIAGLATVASADVLLEVDLGTVDTVTITATLGLSSADESGSNGTGILMVDFFNGGNDGFIYTDGTGDLVSAGTSSNGTPGIFNNGGDNGFNFFAWTRDAPSTFTTGAVAFTGSASWSVSAGDYAEMLAGNAGGDIYAFVDSDVNIPRSTNIGQWRVVPAPGSMALLGLGGIVAGRRRR